MSQHQTPADTDGIKRLALFAAPAESDPLADIMNALEELINFVANDAINAGSFNPNLQGPNEPDVYGQDQHIAAVIAEVRKLLAPAQTAAPEAVKPHPAPGILTTHNPASTGFVWGLVS